MRRTKAIIAVSALLVTTGASEPRDKLADRLYELPRSAFAPEETDEQYRARMRVLSSAIRTVPRQWRAYVGAVWVNETHLAVDVHAGERGHFGSDGGRAKCLGQIHRHGLTIKEWESLGGLDIEATTRCATQTAKILARQASACGLSDPARIFDAYGTGNCSRKIPEKSRKRRLDVLSKLQAETQ